MTNREISGVIPEHWRSRAATSVLESWPVTEREARRERVREAISVTRAGDVAAIVGLLDSPEPAVRQHAAIAILRKRIVSALPALRSRIESESDPEVRSSFALALAELAEPDSRVVLRGLLDDPEEGNRRMALRGLSLLGEEAVTAPAVAMYKTASGRFARYEALDALARLQTEQARAELNGLLSAETSWRWRRRIGRARKSAPPYGLSGRGRRKPD